MFFVTVYVYKCACAYVCVCATLCVCVNVIVCGVLCGICTFLHLVEQIMCKAHTKCLMMLNPIRYFWELALAG